MSMLTSGTGNTLVVLVIAVQHQEFCVRTMAVREIRGWTPVTPLPYAPPEVMGITNLRGTAIPIVDLSVKLGMAPTVISERSAIVVAEIGPLTVGLLVEGVSDLVTVSADTLQPMPQATSISSAYSDGIIAQGAGMICFLSLERMFMDDQNADWTIAA